MRSKECERAVAEVIKKLLWGNDAGMASALEGFDRYFHGEGIYSLDGGTRTVLLRAAIQFFLRGYKRRKNGRDNGRKGAPSSTLWLS